MNKQVSPVSKLVGIVIALLVFGYIGYWSITGLMSEEVFITTKKAGFDYVVYTGGPKLLLCISGLLITLPFLLMVLIATYVKFRKMSPNKHSRRFVTAIPCLMLIGLVGFVCAYIWQLTQGFLYV